MNKGNLKNKKKSIKMVAVICTMVTILTATMLTAFASNSTYRSNGTTQFDCRIPVGGEKGKIFKAVDSTATLRCSVMPELRATHKECIVYQVYVDSDGNEFIKAKDTINRQVKGGEDRVNHETVTFTQKTGSNYKYVMSIYPVKYDKISGLIKEWPKRKPGKDGNCVVYPFVITSLELDY